MYGILPPTHNNKSLQPCFTTQMIVGTMLAIPTSVAPSMYQHEFRHFATSLPKIPNGPFTTFELLDLNLYPRSTNFHALAAYLRSLGYAKKATRVGTRVRDVWVKT